MHGPPFPRLSASRDRAGRTVLKVQGLTLSGLRSSSTSSSATPPALLDLRLLLPLHLQTA